MGFAGGLDGTLGAMLSCDRFWEKLITLEINKIITNSSFLDMLQNLAVKIVKNLEM